MPSSISPFFDIARRRLRAQRLASNRLDSPVDVVRWMGAIQAQDYSGAKWGIAQRTLETTDAAIDALLDDGTLIRTHVLRPTWHIVIPEDLRWMLELTAARIHAFDAARRRQLGLDVDVLQRCRTLIQRELRDGNHRTRTELAALLESNGIATRENRMAHILIHNELDAIICSGPRRAGQFTYALFEERITARPTLSRDEALAAAARRYFTSHGPATAHDFGWWACLTMGDARRGIALLGEELASETIEGKVYLFAADAEPPERMNGVVHLLPNYDEHMVAYRDHTPSRDPTVTWDGVFMADRVAPHVVTVDGLAVGGWRRVPGRGETIVELALQRRLSKGERAGLQRAAEEYERVLGMPVRLSESVSKAPSRRNTEEADA